MVGLHAAVLLHISSPSLYSCLWACYSAAARRILVAKLDNLALYVNCGSIRAGSVGLWQVGCVCSMSYDTASYIIDCLGIVLGLYQARQEGQLVGWVLFFGWWGWYTQAGLQYTASLAVLEAKSWCVPYCTNCAPVVCWCMYCSLGSCNIQQQTQHSSSSASPSVRQAY